MKKNMIKSLILAALLGFGLGGISGMAVANEQPAQEASAAEAEAKAAAEAEAADAAKAAEAAAAEAEAKAKKGAAEE